MPHARTGVYPVYENQFQIGDNAEGATTIADLESFSVSFDNNVETWTPMNAEGWQRALMTGKSITISVTGKRNLGDTGNDYIADKAFKNGRDAEAVLVWNFPDGTVVNIPCVVNVTALGSGGSTDVGPLEADFQSNGKPTVTPAA